MASPSQIIELNMPGEQAVDWAIQRMVQVGLSVCRSFDFQAARQTHPDCPCPHHGASQCTCQFIVLLVYPDGEGPPASVVVHSQDERSWMELQGVATEIQACGAVQQIVDALFMPRPRNA